MKSPKRKVRLLKGNDLRQVDAAEGWLGLGNWAEANEELEQITPLMRMHPLVMHVRYEIYAAAGRWEKAFKIARAIAEMVPGMPCGFIHSADALHKLGKTKEAQAVLTPLINEFREGKAEISYRLACYATHLGQLRRGLRWLKKALALDRSKNMKLRALADQELRPLWSKLANL